VNAEKPGVLWEGAQRLDVSAFGEDYDEHFFGTRGIERLRAWCRQHTGTCPHVPDDARWASAVKRPSKIICVGLNYHGHAREMNAEVPKEPILFFKATSALAGANDDVVLPRGSRKTDWEVELGVVIGTLARYVERDAAQGHVAGYVLHNDYSEREFQMERGGQWVKGKSADTFAPLGPWLVTGDEFDPRAADLWLTVNGERKQTGNTADLIFDVPTLVSYISQFMTLLPGDVISTGTPAGVGMGQTPPAYLCAGDVVECGITGLGRARQQIVAYPLGRALEQERQR
jgi:2-keto-4-pentenoate hydratase/2-oxohepta-3-ene-1,7-dioic acid hydratase in catechol pathway